MSSNAFVTLATNDTYALGALVLAESIRKVGTQANLVVLISNHLSDFVKEALQTSFDEVTVVDELNSNDEEHLRLLSRPELGITFTKINCWLLEQYDKCVFLDSDCLVLRPIDDLFEREELSAAPDAGWPDCFNSGVFVYRPSRETFRKLMEFSSQQNASFDGGDQGLLNDYFSDWGTGDISRHLPFTYNVTANAFYSYLPAVTRFRNDIHVVHFAGATKPWQLTYNPQNEQLSGNSSGQSDIQRDFLLAWWRVMHQRVWPKLSKFHQLLNSNNPSSTHSQNGAGQFPGSFQYATLSDNQGVALGSVAHRRAWEAGHIDYFGRDSFSNIQQQLERNIAHLPQQYHPSQPRQITPEKTTTTAKVNTAHKEPLQPITNLPQSSPKVAATPAPAPVQQVTKVTTAPMPVQQVTNVGITPAPVQQATKVSATPMPAQQVTNGSTAPTPVHQVTNVATTSARVQQATKMATAPTAVQQVTNVTTTSAPVQQVTKVPSAAPLKEVTTPLMASSQQSQLAAALSKPLLREVIPPLSQPILGSHQPVKEPPRSPQATSAHGNTQSLLGSPLSTRDHATAPHTPESNWKVKSTIVTAYTQGVGPTHISKVVSESSASSDHDVPIITSITEKGDAIIMPGNRITAKTTNDHFAWLFEKLFIAITYTISLCYLVFLVAIRRSKNSSIVHDNGRSVRDVPPASTSANGTRVSK